MKQIVILMSLFAFTSSCVKERHCECKNSFGTYSAGDIKTSKSKAKKSCKELSTADTECYLKQ